MRRRLPVVLLVLAAAGCGGSSHTAAPPATTATTTGTTTPSSGPNALQAEANATAAGDIPDNQVFLVFRNGRAGYSMRYPEGWAQRGAAGSVVFRDKNNIVRIVIRRGPAPTVTAARRDLSGASITTAPQAVRLPAGNGVKVVYGTTSAPNAVTGKRVRLVVDRYYLWRRGRTAIVDLGTPEGVDNVDAYRSMIESFRWMGR